MRLVKGVKENQVASIRTVAAKGLEKIVHEVEAGLMPRFYRRCRLERRKMKMWTVSILLKLR